MRSVSRNNHNSISRLNTSAASMIAENSRSASAPEVTFQQTTSAPEASFEPSVVFDVGNDFHALTSSHSKNSKRNFAHGLNGSEIPRGNLSCGHAVHQNIQYSNRKSGIQPIHKGQVPTSLRSLGSSDAPLYPLQPMQFPLLGYEFRLACMQCFKENSQPIDICHACREDFLIVCNTKFAVKRWRLIREPQNPSIVRRYTLCRHVLNGANCPKGDTCWFAHNQDECQLWNLQHSGTFRIDDFISSNRTPGNLSRFTVEAVFSKHPGMLSVICKACFRYNRFFAPLSLPREKCIKGLHDLKFFRVLAHRDLKTGVVTLINDRPFRAKRAFFNYCRYGNYCRKNVRCTFAHNVIEYDLWYVMRDSNSNEEQILERWQKLSGSLKYTGQCLREWRTSERSASGSLTHSVATSYSSVAARKLSTVSESATGEITRCPFSVTRACAVCIHAGQLSGKSGDRCTRGHSWDLNKVYVTMPSKKEVRGIPKEISRRRRVKFYLCKMAKRDCRYGSQCQRAHNEEELQLWSWMAANNVNSLESIVQSSETQTAARTSLSSLFTQPNSASASGEGFLFPPLMQSQWICDFCSYSCSSQNEFLRHSSTVAHQFNVNSDKEHQWNFRQPPWNVRGGLYRLCLKHEQDKLCRYSHAPQIHNYCTFAHSSDELDEWKERFKWRAMKKKAAQDDNLYSYMAKLIKDYKGNGCLTISEEINGVSAECSEPLSVMSDNKLKVKEWTFTINSELRDLHTVALLYEEGFLHFALVGEDLEENCQIADGETFQTGDMEYKVKVRFTGGLFGSFHQWVIFDFGLRPVLVRKLSIELGQPVICHKLLVLKEEMKFNRWTSLNRVIVNFSCDSPEPDGFAVELLTQYKEPNAEAIKLQQISQTQLNTFNYKHRMHALIDLEELAQAKILSTSSQFDVVTTISVTNCISDEWDGMQFSKSGQLFALVKLDSRLLEGGLISSSSVSTALLGPKDSVAGGIVYESKVCNFDGKRALKGKDYIYLTLSKRCCEEMKLKHGDRIEAEIQFQLDRLTFCRMHYGIDHLNVVGIVFAETKHINHPSAWDPKYQIDLNSSELNEDQRKVINYVVIRRQQITWPMVVYGPFGTGKTKTLAEAAILLTTQNNDAKILICTWTNHAADEYVLRYFHSMVTENFSILRVYDKFRHINTVDPLVLPYCLYREGNTRNFQEPSVADIRSRRIIITTLETSLILTRMNLCGHFTHIFIDEAAQALECHTVMPLCLADEKTCVVLAGDHIQMTQQVHSEEAIRQNFHVSLVERMISGYLSLSQQKMPLVLFGSNYRNHPEIMKFVGRIFYGGEGSLKSVGTHQTSTVFPPLAFFAAKDGKEEQHSSSTSFYNAAEIYEIVDQINQLLCHWPSEWGEKQPAEVLVTAPYTDQVAMIRHMLKKHSNPDLSKVVVLKVQNIPGKEFRAVFISTVRTFHLLADSDSDQEQSLGFLNDEKLLNSALTRARSAVAVIGDPIALCCIGKCSKIWREYIKHCMKLNSITPSGLNIDWIRLQVAAMTKNIPTENPGDVNQDTELIYSRNHPQYAEDDWDKEFQLPEDEITHRLRN